MITQVWTQAEHSGNEELVYLVSSTLCNIIL